MNTQGWSTTFTISTANAVDFRRTFFGMGAIVHVWHDWETVNVQYRLSKGTVINTEQAYSEELFLDFCMMVGKEIEMEFRL